MERLEWLLCGIAYHVVMLWPGDLRWPPFWQMLPSAGLYANMQFEEYRQMRTGCCTCVKKERHE